MKRIIIFSMCLCGLLTCAAQTESRDASIHKKFNQYEKINQPEKLKDAVNKSMQDRLRGKTTSEISEMDNLKKKEDGSKVAVDASKINPIVGHRINIGVNHNGGELPKKMTVRNEREKDALENTNRYTQVKEEQSEEKVRQSQVQHQDPKQYNGTHTPKNGSMSQQHSKKVGGKGSVKQQGKNNTPKNGSMSQQQGKEGNSGNVNTGKRPVQNIGNSVPNSYYDN